MPYSVKIRPPSVAQLARFHALIRVLHWYVDKMRWLYHNKSHVLRRVTFFTLLLLRKSFISSNEEAIIIFEYSRRNLHVGLEKPSLYLLIVRTCVHVCIRACVFVGGPAPGRWHWVGACIQCVGYTTAAPWPLTLTVTLSVSDRLMHAAHDECALFCPWYPGSVPDLHVFVITPAWHI